MHPAAGRRSVPAHRRQKPPCSSSMAEIYKNLQKTQVKEMTEFDFNIVKDPEIFRQNVLPAHSDHAFYSEAPAKVWAPSDCTYSLNGVWKFSYAQNPQTAVQGFEAADYDCTGWDEIRVPGHVEMQGYGHPQYANTQYPWDGIDDIVPGEIPTRFNPTSSYVRYFTVTPEMKKHALHICFDGVESGFALWVNGHYIGYSEDSFTPSEFDLTPYVEEGENRLAVRVFRYTAASWCEDQDFFRFSGIFRDVKLISLPDTHIYDLHLVPEVNVDDHHAELEVRISATAAGRVECTLDDVDGRVIAAATQEIEKTEENGADPASCDGVGERFALEKVEELQGFRTSIRLEAGEVKLWSAEEPYLYTVRLRVFDTDGVQQETVLEHIGFRRFEIIDHIMHLNGQRIVFNGVNRHEFSADRGRAIDDETIRFDLLMMKRNNINAVRTSHYPNKTALYRYCDLYGLYVIDETNLESHGLWDMVLRGNITLEETAPGDRPEYQRMILDRANNMLARDKNHASILLWSCGNESLGGKDLYEMSRFFRKADPTRLVHYEGVAHDERYPDTTDVVSTMYTPADDIRAFLAEHREKPYICCEYAHAMGNSNGAFLKYVKLTEEEPLYQGGFIWDYIDQAIETEDRYGRRFLGYGGDFDDRPCDGNFSGNGIVYGDTRQPSPKMQEVRNGYQSIVVTLEAQEMPEADDATVHALTKETKQVALDIWNKYLFTDTAAFDCFLTLEKEGVEIGRRKLELSVAAKQRKRIELPVQLPAAAGEYVVTVSFRTKENSTWAEAGTELAWGQTVIRREDKDASERPCCAEAIRRMQIIRGAWNLGVHGENFDVLFSTLHGGLVSYRYAGKELLKASPRPNFWRAMTDNDLGCTFPQSAAPWRSAGLYATTKYASGRRVTEYEVSEDENAITITYTYHLATIPAKDCFVSYTVTADGEVRVKQQMEASAEVGELPEFSMLFTLDGRQDQLRWYGPGPDETYMDRCHAKIGVYASTTEDSVAGYLRPQECGNHVDVRWAELTDAQGAGLRFETNGLQFSALPYSPEQLECAKHPNELPASVHTYVRVGLQMGVGGDDSWGAQVHPEYHLDNTKPMEISFSFRGI